MKKFLSILLVALVATAVMQAQDNTNYLAKAFELLLDGNIESAEKHYTVHKRLTGQTDADFEELLYEKRNNANQTLFVFDGKVYKNKRELRDREIYDIFCGTKSYYKYRTAKHHEDLADRSVIAFCAGGTIPLLCGGLMQFGWLGPTARDHDREMRPDVAYAGLALVGVGLLLECMPCILKVSAKVKLKRAIKIYNNDLLHQPTSKEFNVSMGFVPNGIGVTCTF